MANDPVPFTVTGPLASSGPHLAPPLSSTSVTRIPAVAVSLDLPVFLSTTAGDGLYCPHLAGLTQLHGERKKKG